MELGIKFCPHFTFRQYSRMQKTPSRFPALPFPAAAPCVAVYGRTLLWENSKSNWEACPPGPPRIDALHRSERVSIKTWLRIGSPFAPAVHGHWHPHACLSHMGYPLTVGAENERARNVLPLVEYQCISMELGDTTAACWHITDHQ